MSGMNQSKMMFNLMNEGKHDMSSKFMSSKNDSELPLMDNPRSIFAYSKHSDIKEREITIHEPKRMKEDNDSTVEKLKSFFETVQKQHPESRLELQYVDGTWKVWCGACKKLLRPDKSGKAIHNIQRQHFSSSRHKKKLHLMLQAEEEEAERRRKNGVGKSNQP